MRAHVGKWGNSLAIRIPKAFAAEARFDDGTPVELTIADGKLIAAPVRAPRTSLRQLVSRVRSAQLGGETAWGRPTGNEAW